MFSATGLPIIFSFQILCNLRGCICAHYYFRRQVDRKSLLAWHINL
jgi:hypothetical protein